MAPRQPADSLVDPRRISGLSPRDPAALARKVLSVEPIRWFPDFDLCEESQAVLLEWPLCFLLRLLINF